MESTNSLVVNLLFLLTGALVVGLCSYFLRSKTDSGIAREQVARRLALVEEVALHIGSVHYIFQKYWALISESFRFKDNWPLARKNELDAVTEELVVAFNDLSLAESKLLLLDEKNLCKILKIYTSKIAHFRKSYYVSKSGVTEDEMGEIKKEITNIRDKFFEVLSKRYTKKLE